MTIEGLANVFAGLTIFGMLVLLLGNLLITGARLTHQPLVADRLVRLFGPFSRVFRIGKLYRNSEGQNGK
jgi:hypothetical protein